MYITHIDPAICGIVLSSTTYTGIEGEGLATVCLQLLGETSVDISVQLDTVNGSGTATGKKNVI